MVTEKGARRFDRFEQWLMRHLVDPENLYAQLRERLMPIAGESRPSDPPSRSGALPSRLRIPWGRSGVVHES
jgi:hypothetical protein